MFRAIPSNPGVHTCILEQRCYCRVRRACTLNVYGKCSVRFPPFPSPKQHPSPVAPPRRLDSSREALSDLPSQLFRPQALRLAPIAEHPPRRLNRCGGPVLSNLLRPTVHDEIPGMKTTEQCRRCVFKRMGRIGLIEHCFIGGGRI